VNTPLPNVPLTVNYRSGFSADSVIVFLDRNLMGKSAGSSNGVLGTTGWVLVSSVGLHSVSLELPFYQIRAGTGFVAMEGQTTQIDADFDRTHNTITFSITHVPLR